MTALRTYYSSAAPVLRKLKLPATLFVLTGLSGKTSDGSGQETTGIIPRPLLDWQQVAELAQQGFELGAHSVSHPVLPDLPAETAKREITESKAELKERTGQAVDFFAYPYGQWSPAVRAVVQEHYRGACSTGAGVVQPDADPFVLPRVDVHYLRRPAWFRTLFTTRFLTYVAGRRFIRRIRNSRKGFTLGFPRVVHSCVATQMNEPHQIQRNVILMPDPKALRRCCRQPIKLQFV